MQCDAGMRWPAGPNKGIRPTICAECAPSKYFQRTVREYGVDKAMFDAMYFEQDGKCAIGPCPREARSVDHCHRSGKVRGLLCQGCNAAIGSLEGYGWLDDVRGYLAA